MMRWIQNLLWAIVNSQTVRDDLERARANADMWDRAHLNACFDRMDAYRECRRLRELLDQKAKSDNLNGRPSKEA